MTVLTDEERRFGTFMLATAVLYGLGALSFGILPSLTQRWGGLGGAALGLPVGDALPGPMWLVLGVSMMCMLTLCCLMVGRDPRGNRPFVLPVLLSKWVSSLYAGTLVILGQAEASALGTVATDLPLFVATFVLARSAMRSVNGKWLIGGPFPAR
jgi:hypothetical protein